MMASSSSSASAPLDSSSSSSSCEPSSPRCRRFDELKVSVANDDKEKDMDYSSLPFLGPTSTAVRSGVWRRIGVLGGGQLGRMLAEEARLLNVQIVVLDPTKNCPASQVGAEHILGDFRDRAAIETLASRVDILTVEIEHVDTEALEAAALKYNIPVHPSPRTLRIIQDKYLQKEHLRNHGVPTADYCDTPNAAAIAAAAEKFGLPLMLKSRTLAYDGRGNYLLKSADRDSIHHAIAVLTAATKNNKVVIGEDSLPLYAESFQEFDRELSVMVVRSPNHGCCAYPAVQTVHVDSICHTCIAPAQIDGSIRREAETTAVKAVASFEGAGVFGVELFLLKNGKILLNEIAPRPHNSGHYTIEACNVSQFGNHLRVLLGLPLGSPTMRVPISIMVNVLGTGNNPDIDIPLSWLPCEAALHVPGATVHWYGKSGVALKRKLAHITFVGDSISHIEGRIKRWQKTAEALKAKFRQQIGSSTDGNSSSNTAVALIPPSASSASVEKKESKSTESNRSLTPVYPESSPIISPWLGLQFALSARSPLVAVIMGSDSDLPTMRPALSILEEFSIPFEVSIVSAHRTPDRLMKYAKAAAGRGIKTIIAAAGGAAHLPGMVAAITPLPVIGVPVPLTYLDGQDSLYSIVQMPRGIPVATVAIGNSTNGALLAVRILSVHWPSLLISMQNYLKRMESEVYQKVDKLNQQGWKNYTPSHK